MLGTDGELEQWGCLNSQASVFSAAPCRFSSIIKCLFIHITQAGFQISFELLEMPEKYTTEWENGSKKRPFFLKAAC